MGVRRLVVIDPGPADDDEHIEALAERMSQADEATILLTHGHSDHAAALEALMERTGVPARGVGHDAVEVLRDGDVVETDQGVLIAVDTPGHASSHITFHWPKAHAAFVGDLVLGRGDTTWVGEYPGCVEEYLASLDRVERLGCAVLYPAHGDAISDVPGCLKRYRAHRLERIQQVRDVMGTEPEVDLDRLYDRVYGDMVPDGFRRAAEMSLEALMDYIRARRA